MSQNELLLPDKWVAYYPSDPSGIERRKRLVLARWRLASSLRIFEVRVGFVFRRIWGFCAALDQFHKTFHRILTIYFLRTEPPGIDDKYTFFSNPSAPQR